MRQRRTFGFHGSQETCVSLVTARSNTIIIGVASSFFLPAWSFSSILRSLFAVGMEIQGLSSFESMQALSSLLSTQQGDEEEDPKVSHRASVLNLSCLSANSKHW